MDDPPAVRLVHELKSPLTAIKGLAATGTKLFDEISEDDRRRFYALIEGEADRLRRVVDQVAEYLRLTSDAAGPVAETLDLERIVEEAASKTDLGRHPLHVAIPSGTQIRGDARLVERTLSEALDNAARFSPPESPIEVTAEAHGERVVVRVRDEGPGLGDEDLGHAFDLCAEVRPPGFEEVPGAGMSLYLARAHLERMGGTIGLMRDSGNPGTILALELPRGGIPDG